MCRGLPVSSGSGTFSHPQLPCGLKFWPLIFFLPGLNLHYSLGGINLRFDISPDQYAQPFTLSPWMTEGRVKGTQEGYTLVWTKAGGGEHGPLAGPGEPGQTGAL